MEVIMDSSIIKFIPIGVWAFSAATSIVIVIVALYFYIFYRKRLSAVQGTNQDAADLLNLKQQLEQDVISIRDWISNQKDELLRLEAERKEQEVIRAELQRLEQECAKKDQGNLSLREEVGQLETKKHLIEQSLDTLNADVNKIKDELKKLEENLSKSIELIEKNQMEIAKQDKVKNEFEELIKIAGKELDVAQKQITELEAEKKGLKESRSDLQEQIDTLKKELKEIQKSRKDQEDEVKALDSRKLELSGEVKSLADKLKSVGTMPPEAFESLNTPVFSVPDATQGDVTEQNALDRLYSLTETSGFTLPTRLQNAFHTALKTSDISCLTVMAGVSGTGKSAFPKLYAQSMGIHFLPLAVEPRWDSPHDLFGFLNYMENRYEATTLCRALVQFNNSKHGHNGFATLKDQVLIVLLDEMNLARIEYYFSEFLSKLEMRRNIDPNNETDYKMVSAEVFAGYPGDKKRAIKPSPAVHLFAGSNILFVGTMNEDETTQSLSDKVIDRANVVYFGQPNRLENREQKVQTQSNWQPIAYDTWRSWIVEPEERNISDFGKIDDLVNQINVTLGKLGRPYGWRTYKAMMTYVANYPGVSSRGERGMGALADQVAMRVMPKLRGLDLAEYADIFSTLSSQIDQINDSALSEAFSKANTSTLGFFDWRGISWE